MIAEVLSYFTKIKGEICIEFICTKCDENVKIWRGFLFNKAKKK